MRDALVERGARTVVGLVDAVERIGVVGADLLRLLVHLLDIGIVLCLRIPGVEVVPRAMRIPPHVGDGERDHSHAARKMRRQTAAFL